MAERVKKKVTAFGFDDVANERKLATSSKGAAGEKGFFEHQAPPTDRRV